MKVRIIMRPDIQVLIDTLKRKKSAYIPLAELGIHPKIKAQFLGRPLKTLKDDVDFWHQAGYDYIKLQPQVDFNPDKIGVSGDPVFKDGSLSYDWASEGQGVITDSASFERYRFPEKTDIDYSKFEQVGQYLPEGMGVIGQYGDIFTMTWEMMGFETFSLALYTDPDLVKTLNDKVGEIVLSMFEYFAQSDAVQVLWYSDDIAFSNALLVSPDALRQYLFPWLKKIGDLAQKYDKPLIYHTDGLLWDVFEDIIDCGVSAIHPIEPKAMDIAEVKQRYGDKLCLVGHVDLDLLCRGTADEVRANVRDVVGKAAYNGGYAAGSSNSIPDYVNFENYLAMLDEIKQIKSL